MKAPKKKTILKLEGLQHPEMLERILKDHVRKMGDQEEVKE